MSDPDFMLTDEERRLKQRKRRVIYMSIFALLALIVFVIFGGRPTLNAIKAWQARRHADKAFAFIAQEKWMEARSEAVAAYQLRPTEPQALRAVARFLSRTRQLDALDFWKQLQDRQLLTREDRRDEAAVALAAGDIFLADAAVRELIAAKPEAADWLLAAQLSIQKGAPEDARKFIEKIDARANEREQFQAALLDLATSANQEQVNEAWSRVEKLSRGQSATALDALVMLARRVLSDATRSSQLSDKSYQDAESAPNNRQPITDNPPPPSYGVAGREPITNELAPRLASHPLAKASQKLLALDLLAHVDVRAGQAETQREALISKAIADSKDADADSLAALAAWLNSKGEYQRQLDTIPLEKALQDKDLFLQHLDALGALGRWIDIKQLLESDRFPLDPVVQHMYLARCNAQLGEKTSAENNWKRALEAASGDPGKLLSLGDYAAKNGNLAIAESAYTTAAIESPKLRPAFQGKLRMAQAQRDARKIHGVLAEMLRIWPNDSAVQNDEAYLRLLLMFSNSRNDEARMSNVEKDKIDSTDTTHSTSSGQAPRVPPNQQPITDNPPSQNYGAASQELITISALAESLVQREPASLPHRTLLALARLKLGRAAEALSVYENINVRPGALTPSALAVHAAVLAANGKMDDAKTEAAQIKIDNLLSEERELIQDLL
jgi:tetratricopeptide (TPR) repeat protein